MTKQLLFIAGLYLVLSVPVLAQDEDSADAKRGRLGVMVQPMDERLMKTMKAAIKSKGSAEDQEKAEKQFKAMKPGLLVVGLMEGGPAQKAGVKLTDILLNIGDV